MAEVCRKESKFLAATKRAALTCRAAMAEVCRKEAKVSGSRMTKTCIAPAGPFLKEKILGAGEELKACEKLKKFKFKKLHKKFQKPDFVRLAGPTKLPGPQVC